MFLLFSAPESFESREQSFSNTFPMYWAGNASGVNGETCNCVFVSIIVFFCYETVFAIIKISQQLKVA